MIDPMRRLVRLQEVMQAQGALADRIAAIPAEVAHLEKDLLAAQKEIDSSKAALLEVQKDRRKLESDLMGVESKITKYQAQLSEVKTNKEYQTILHEIETARAERAAFDERILLEMEEGEKRNAAVRAREDELKNRRRVTEEGKKRLDEKSAALRREQEVLEAERKELVASLPAEYLDPFLKVARQRNGLALVPVRNELCGGCHVRVMPKLVQEVRRATGLIPCDSCKRFIYFPEDANAPAAPAPGAADASAPAAASEPPASEQ